jgi:hypothetical protein
MARYFAGFLIVLAFLSFARGAEIQNIGTIELIQRNDFYIGIPHGIVVTENGQVIVCDTKTADFKIYSPAGIPIGTFGHKGYGPDEFSQPWLHDYRTGRVLVSNSSTKKLFIYRVQTGTTWIKESEISAVSVLDAKLMTDPDRVLFCRFPIPDHPSGRSYIVLIKGIETNAVDYLVPFEAQFGPGTEPIDMGKLGKLSPSQMPDFIAMPQWKFCDYWGDDVFFAWTASPTIIRINLKASDLQYIGRPAKDYAKPEVTRELRKAYYEHQSGAYRKCLERMSWVAKIFADDHTVGIVFSKYDHKISRWQAYVQLYEHDGRLVGEGALPGFSTTYERGEYFYDKDKRILFGLSDDLRDSESVFTLHAYRIAK